MLRIFGLRQEATSSRGDNDAYLDLEGKSTQCLELKSSTSSDFVTARDFSLQHIQDWREKHILTSFYDKGGNRINWSLLVPNVVLQNWLDEQTEYIKCEVAIMSALPTSPPSVLAETVMSELFGGKDKYTKDELKVVLKRQLTNAQYSEYLDIREDGIDYCSPESMMKAILARTKYLVNRGSTRNNPHFSRSWILKTVEYDSRLRFDHESGDFSKPKDWLYAMMNTYAI